MKLYVCVSVHLSVHPHVRVSDTLAALLTRHTVNKWWETDEMRWKTKGHKSQNGGKMDVWKGARAAGATRWRDERRRNRLGVNDGDIGWDVQAGWVISKRREQWDDKKSTKTKGSNQDDDRWPRGKERWLEKKMLRERRVHSKSKNVNLWWYHTLLATLIRFLCSSASVASPLTQTLCFPLLADSV